MAFGNFYGNYQPMYNPTGAMQDTLGQFKGQYMPVINQTPALQNMQQPMTPPQNNGLLWVQGEAGAKSFCVAPGQNVLLMDSESMRFYIKSADASGMPLPLRTFEYCEVNATSPINHSPVATDKYITREEFEERLSKLTLKQEASNE